MFKIMSLKSYRRLKDAEARMRKSCEEILEKADKRYESVQQENTRLSGWLEKQRDFARDLGKKHQKVRAERDALATELEKYKMLFADELQKRLALSEKVQELEKTAEEIDIVRASIPGKLNGERIYILRKIIQMLTRGIPQDDGTLCKSKDAVVTALVADLDRCTNGGDEDV